MQYGNWLHIWLDDYVRPTSKSKTYERYTQIVRNHLERSLGGYELCELTPWILQRFITNLLAHGNLKTGGRLSANTVNGILGVIQGSLKAAHLTGATPCYIGDKLTRPRVESAAVLCFTLPEQKRIEQAILHASKKQLFGIVLCLYTGLRIGELLALEWRDIDFSAGILSVNRSCHDGKRPDGTYGRITESPKTATSKRMIPLPAPILDLLMEIKKECRSIYVISNGNKPLSVRSYQRSFQVLLERLEIPHRGFHSLRHTFATRALECGMDVKTLSEILGHKSSAITLNRYAHSLTEHKIAMMARVGQLL